MVRALPIVWIGILGGLIACSAAPKDEVRITHGPMVGAVSADSITLWLRTNQAARVRVLYGNPTRSNTANIDASKDFSTKLRIDQLAPRTTYHYALWVNDALQYQGSFTTFPASGDETPFRFVILSDFRTVSKITRPVATFASAAKENPAFVILGGDFDHRNPTTREEKRAMFRELYTPANGMEDFVNLILHRYPLIHFWDDHDYGANNADKSYPHKELSLRVLEEYFPLYPISRHGDWQSFTYGNADFFVLDSRSQRDPAPSPDGASKSMLDGDELGAEGQRAWLLDGLKNSRAKWKFILSPVIFNPTTKQTDAWGAYPTERAQILDFIRTNHITGVIVLSGDLHAGGIDDGRYAGLPEMTVPTANDGFDKRCLTEPSGHIGQWSVGSYGDASGTPCNGYGVVDVFPDRVELVVKDSEGRTRVEFTVALQ